MSAEVYDSFLTEAVIPNGTLKVHRPSAGQFSIFVEGDCIRGEQSGKRILAEFAIFERKSPLIFEMIRAIAESQPTRGTEVISSFSYALFTQIFCKIRSGKLSYLGTV